MWNSRACRQVDMIWPHLRQLHPSFQYQTSTPTMTFYITLLSDASHEEYTNNTIARYRLLLPRPVELLQVVWEVGLCELSYPTPVFVTEQQPIFEYCDLIGPQMVGDNSRAVSAPSTTHLPTDITSSIKCITCLCRRRNIRQSP